MNTLDMLQTALEDNPTECSVWDMFIDECMERHGWTHGKAALQAELVVAAARTRREMAEAREHCTEGSEYHKIIREEARRVLGWNPRVRIHLIPTPTGSITLLGQTRPGEHPNELMSADVGVGCAWVREIVAQARGECTVHTVPGSVS